MLLSDPYLWWTILLHELSNWSGSDSNVDVDTKNKVSVMVLTKERIIYLFIDMYRTYCIVKFITFTRVYRRPFNYKIFLLLNFISDFLLLILLCFNMDFSTLIFYLKLLH